MVRRHPATAARAAICGLAIAALATPGLADPVPGWSFMTWSVAPEAVKAGAEAAGLAPMAVSADDADMYGLPQSTVPFAFRVKIYGQPAIAYPIFDDGGLDAIRFVLADPSVCRGVLDGLTADYGPGTPDERGFSNINWPTTKRFGLTVVVTEYFCWPLFSKPGV